MCGYAPVSTLGTHLKQSANAHRVKKFGFTPNAIQFQDAGNGRLI